MLRTVIFLSILVSFLPAAKAQNESPKSLDPRVTIRLFAAEPDIVTPTGIAVDHRGRVFCIESHTHFRPKDYKGPAADRIRIYEDTDGDGKADRIRNFFEGTTATMNLAFGSDRKLYVATRASIFRLSDTDGDDVADRKESIVQLKTKGNYPHNGLSGLAFQDGRLFFGFGENLGVDYELIGSDGTTLRGGGEGGNIYRCQLDGSGLERIATGFWNPFGLAFDKTGNLIAIDNDPDWRPPCRLLHIVDGGDYGYRFSHGRRGTHPFTAWFGELPGTLGMISGTGEAPSGIVRYDRLSPDQSTSTMLSTSWGLHSIEQFDLQRSGATLTSNPRTLIKGPKDFRPVGIALAPDGSLFVSDWCKRSYELHGFGRIWKISFDGAQEDPNRVPAVPREYPFESKDLLVRELAANRVPADRIDFPRAIQAAISPLEKASLIRRSDNRVSPLLLQDFLADEDPWIQQAARQALTRRLSPEKLVKLPLPDHPLRKQNLALLLRHCDSNEAKERIEELLDDDDPIVRFIAIRWIGEEKLERFAKRIESGIRERVMTAQLFEASLAAIDLINENRRGAEFEKAETRILARILNDPDTRPETLMVALRMLQRAAIRDGFSAQHPQLGIGVLQKLLEHSEPRVSREVVQTLREMDTAESRELLLKVAKDRKKYSAGAADAVIGLDPSDQQHRELLIKILATDSKYRNLAAQTLAGYEFNRADRSLLQQYGVTVNSLLRSPIKRVERGRVIRGDYSRYNKQADPERGRLIFYNRRFGQCSRCHQVEGRGGLIGPDLTNMQMMPVERLIESILLPSNEIAPRHTTWLIETYDGRTLTGVLVGERGEVQSYADSEGKRHEVRFDEIEQRKSLAKSIMPEGLLDRMRDTEVADLIAFLKKRQSKQKTGQR